MVDIIPPLRTEPLFDEFGNMTIRFAEYLEQTAETVNENTNEANTLRLENVLALVNALENRLGSGDALTSDETGFTVDSDKLTVDMTEA